MKEEEGYTHRNRKKVNEGAEEKGREGKEIRKQAAKI